MTRMAFVSKVKVKYIHLYIIMLCGFKCQPLTLLKEDIHIKHNVFLRRYFWMAGMTLERKFKVKNVKLCGFHIPGIRSI